MKLGGEKKRDNPPDGRPPLPELRASHLRTQAEINQVLTVRERLLATLALFFAAIALLLAGSRRRRGGTSALIHAIRIDPATTLNAE